MSHCLQAKVLVAERTEKDIDATRLEYVPVAVRTQILFFCVSDLSNVDPMYQYSLEWFLGIFMNGITKSERAGGKTELRPYMLNDSRYCSDVRCERTSPSLMVSHPSQTPCR